MREEANSNDLAEKFRRFAESRDPKLRDELITANLPLVEQLARRFSHRNEPLDDLVQAGSIGLIKAVEGFDPTLGYEFSAYATTTIIGELKRHFRDRGWSVRAPRRVQELYLRLGPMVEELSQRLGRSPTVRELATESGDSEEAVLEALEAAHAYRSASLDAPAFEGETLGSRLGAIDEDFLAVENRATLFVHLTDLAPRDRVILQLRFVEGLTQSEIAARLGLSQMQISRLLARSLAALHQAFGDEV